MEDASARAVSVRKDPGIELSALRSAITLGLALTLGCAGEGAVPGDEADGARQARGGPCMTPPDTSITGAAVGGLRIHDPVDRVRRECDVVGDTTLMLEGMAQPALLVDLAGDTVVAEIVEDRVWRITVGAPGLATTGSLRVGAPARRVAEREDAAIGAGEGRYFVMAPSLCGLSFEIGGPAPRPGGWTVAELRSAPDDVRISRILVTGGCP